MPAKSKSQKNLFRMVYAYKNGDLKLSDLPKSLQDKIKKVSSDISKKDAKDFTEDKIFRKDLKDTLTEGVDMKSFFKRPLINKGYTKLKRIWQDGGKKNEYRLKEDISENRDLLEPLISEIITNNKYHEFLSENNYSKDINSNFLKAMHMYVTGVAKLQNDGEDFEEKAIDIRELRDIWSSINVHRLHIFVESIIKFRKYTFKEKNLINT